MKIYRSIILAAAALVLAGQAAAQADEEERLRAMEAREAEFAERMREAEQRLAEAAKRVAELSTERLGAIGDMSTFTVNMSKRPMLGVNIGSETPEDGPVEGVRIVSVTPGGAADDAGIRAGDLITSINGESLQAENQMEANKRVLDFMRGVEEGDVLTLEYVRDGKSGTVEVEPRVPEENVFVWTPDGRSIPLPPVHINPEIAQEFRYSFPRWRGTWGDMEVVELSKGLGRYFGTDEGLLVISAPKSNAFKLQDGDVIQSIDGREPKNVNHCMRILDSYQPGEKLTLNIMRDRKPQKVEIEVPDDRTSMLLDRVFEYVRPARSPLPPREREVIVDKKVVRDTT